MILVTRMPINNKQQERLSIVDPSFILCAAVVYQKFRDEFREVISIHHVEVGSISGNNLYSGISACKYWYTLLGCVYLSSREFRSWLGFSVFNNVGESSASHKGTRMQ